MGNLCGKESKDNFSGPGRTLGSAPPAQPARASIPSRSAAAQRADARQKASQPGSGEDAGKAAGNAAESRSSKPTSKGKLGKALDEQKQKTMGQTLQQASKDERRHREIDEMNSARAHA